MREERDSISILSKHHDEILKKIKDPTNEFSSIEEYIDYILNEILYGGDDTKDQEKAEIEDELRKLGYI